MCYTVDITQYATFLLLCVKFEFTHFLVREMEVINDVAGPPACMDPSVLCHMYTNFASSMIWRKH